MVVGAAQPSHLFFALPAYLLKVVLHCCVFFKDLLVLRSLYIHFLTLSLQSFVLLQDAIQLLKSLRILILRFIILTSQLLNFYAKLFTAFLFMLQFFIEQIDIFLKLIDVIA